MQASLRGDIVQFSTGSTGSRNGMKNGSRNGMKKIMTIDVEKLNMSGLFANPHEKGSEEWKSIDAIADDTVNAFDAAPPKKPIAVREKNHVLRIISVAPLRRAH